MINIWNRVDCVIVICFYVSSASSYWNFKIQNRERIFIENDRKRNIVEKTTRKAGYREKRNHAEEE